MTILTVSLVANLFFWFRSHFASNLSLFYSISQNWPAFLDETERVTLKTQFWLVENISRTTNEGQILNGNANCRKLTLPGYLQFVFVYCLCVSQILPSYSSPGVYPKWLISSKDLSISFLKTHLHELTLLLEVFCNTSCAVDTFFISFPKSKHNVLVKD